MSGHLTPLLDPLFTIVAMARHSSDTPAGLTTEEAAEAGCLACQAEVALRALAGEEEWERRRG